MQKKILLFDFDGVIVDSFGAAFGVSKMIYPPLKKEDYLKRFDGNINDSLGGNRDKEGYRTGIDFFKEYVPLLLKSPLAAGMKEILEQLGNNYVLIVISSTITSPIQEYLALHGVAHLFVEIMGNDVRASKIEKIKMVFDKYGVQPENCLFITDTLGDIREASRAGVKVVAVTWGYQSRESLIQGNPLEIIDFPQNLVETIEKYFEGKLA